MSRKAGITPMGKRAFYKAFSDESGFAEGQEKTCCCGSCVDGWLAMTMMQDFVKSSDLGLDPGTHNSSLGTFKQPKTFMMAHIGGSTWKGHHLCPLTACSMH